MMIKKIRTAIDTRVLPRAEEFVIHPSYFESVLIKDKDEKRVEIKPS